MMRLAAVVLAGGAARRLGGGLKPGRAVGGVPLLNRVLAAVADGAAEPIVVVGPPDLAPLLPAAATLTREEPPGSGPVTATAAGLALVPATVPLVALLAADLPFLTGPVIADVAHAAAGGDGALLVDDAGRPQWLCGVWRTEQLRARLRADPGHSMRALLEPLAAVRVHAPRAWLDCDTEEDLRLAEALHDGKTLPDGEVRHDPG